MLNQDPIEYTILRAARFAADKHRLQRRKDPDASPYINHPIAMAETLAWAGVSDRTTLLAAILHDVIEDTETTPEEIEDRRQGYLDWARKVAAGCRGLNSPLDAKFAEMVGWDA